MGEERDDLPFHGLCCQVDLLNLYIFLKCL